jgi:hypothetical protein
MKYMIVICTFLLAKKVFEIIVFNYFFSGNRLIWID